MKLNLSPNKGDMRIWSSDKSWKLVEFTNKIVDEKEVLESVTIKPHGLDQRVIKDLGFGLSMAVNRG